MHTFTGTTTLEVELGSGRVAVRATEGDRTTVEVTGPGADDVEVTELDGVVSIHSRRSFSFGLRRDVAVAAEVPRGCALLTRLGSADLLAQGVFGKVRLASGSGDIALEEASDDGVLKSGSGDVVIGRLGGPATIGTGSGDIRVERTDREVSVKTGSGDVRIGLTAAPARLKSGSGDLRIGSAESEVELTSGSGDLVVERFPRGRLQATNASGRVHVGIPAGVPVWTDVTSVTGRITSRLQGAGQPVDGQPFVSLHARTVSGDVVLDEL